ncbi:MAG: acetoacetate decarboxylase family protein [Chloroflexota bacterium]|nr:acetoacetate decarboxylase family protein [Dehalococcoidia bacterium]MDW8045781.1 acetoacetate decarboxylase family protein [Chloroflexota bacterium]
MPYPRFRRTPEEAELFLAAYRRPVFRDVRALTVPAESEPEALAAILPPPLEPANEPRVVFSIAEVRRSNCAGAFFVATVDISCTFQGERGAFCLAMPVSTDSALIFGRELYGEPKKLAEIHLDERGDGTVHGSVTRHGITYLELSAVLEPTEEPVRESEADRYHFRFLPTPDGHIAGLVELVRVRHRSRVRVTARGQASVTLRDSPHDPLFDIPIRKVLGAAYSEGQMETEGRVVAKVPADQFLPFAFAKVDDLLVWAEEPSGAGR